MAGQLHTPGDSLWADITAPKSARYWDATRTFRAAMGQTERQFPAQGSPEGTPTQSESTVHELSYWLADRLHESPASVVAPASPLSIIMPPELLVPELPAVPPEPPEARLPPISSEPPAPPTREMGGEETGRQQRAPLAPQEYWVSTPATKPPKQGPGYGWQVPPTSSQSFGPVAWPTFELLPVPDIPWPPPEPPPMTDIPGPPLELPADPDIPWSPPMLPPVLDIPWFPNVLPPVPDIRCPPLEPPSEADVPWSPPVLPPVPDIPWAGLVLPPPRFRPVWLLHAKPTKPARTSPTPHVDILNMESSTGSATAICVPSPAALMVDRTSRKHVEMGAGSRGEIMAMESVNPQNSEGSRS